MTKIIFSAMLFSIAMQAQATVYQIGLGQNASLQTGDVAVLQSGNLSSAITCNGSAATNPLPTTQIIDGRKATLFTSLFENNGNDAERTQMCAQITGDANVQQAVTDAANLANETCVNMGYLYCQVPADESQQYSFSEYGSAPGQYGCLVIAHIIGSMQ